MSAFKQRYLFFLLLMTSLSFVAHLPFLKADPDVRISFSRGPFTDEGLYTSNIRNYINHQNYDFNTSDVPVKSPLFTLLFYFPFLIFGVHLHIARLTILILSFLLFVLAIRLNKPLYIVAYILLPLLFFEYHFFHFLHFALADALIPLLVFFGISLSWYYLKKNRPYISAFLSTAIIFISYLLKFQFVYLILLFPVLFFVAQYLVKEERELYKKAFFASVIITLLFALIFILFWYIPHKDEFLLILQTQSQNKFVAFSHLDGNIYLLVKNLVFGRHYLFFSVLFLGFMVFYILFLRKNTKPIFNFFFLAATLWILLESHKLTMTYLPTRYLIPILLPSLLIISLSLSALYLKSKDSKNNIIKYVFYAFIGLIIVYNTIEYYSGYNRRKFEIAKINNYLTEQKISNGIVMGNWASCFTWESNCRSIPIIEDTFRDTLVLKNYNPCLIILEKEDTLNPNIIFTLNPKLGQSVDSIVPYSFNQYNLLFYWRLEHVLNRKP